MRFISIIIIFFTISCSYISPLDEQIVKYVNTIENNLSNMSEIQWEEADQKIKDFKINFEKSRTGLSEEQISIINESFGTYSALRFKSQLKNFKDNLNDASDQVEGFFDKIVTDVSDN